MTTSIHTETEYGVMVVINGSGILITGEAGIGKSSLALALISEGHQLVADDVVELNKEENHLYATCPAMLKGLLNTRELGTINIESVFGDDQLLDSSEINYHLVLSNVQPSEVELEGQKSHSSILGVTVPKLVLTLNNPASISIRLNAWLDMQQANDDADTLLKRRQQQQMQQ
ncbi:MAG TPA: serine kinase [Methylophaga aminisulfidivorans]|uniref:Serine kinase n=2 Tax=root TaxID=1 RepID=A0A7C2ANN5_9GAMM|nr:serine kinase [Methylophaga aminisulfidivorans]